MPDSYRKIASFLRPESSAACSMLRPRDRRRKRSTSPMLVPVFICGIMFCAGAKNPAFEVVRRAGGAENDGGLESNDAISSDIWRNCHRVSPCLASRTLLCFDW